MGVSAINGIFDESLFRMSLLHELKVNLQIGLRTLFLRAGAHAETVAALDGLPENF